MKLGWTQQLLGTSLNSKTTRTTQQAPLLLWFHCKCSFLCPPTTHQAQRNVLFTHNDLWITDFGASTDFPAIGTSVSEDGDQGTPRYRAPEVCERQPNRR